MTSKFQNGDLVIGSRGVPATVDGAEELLQQARIRLQAHRGRFSLDPELGSSLYQLDLSRADLQTVEARIREALAPLPEIELSGLSQNVDARSGQIRIRAELSVKNFPATESVLLTQE